jgi:hypothetical protein
MEFISCTLGLYDHFNILFDLIQLVSSKQYGVITKESFKYRYIIIYYQRPIKFPVHRYSVIECLFKFRYIVVQYPRFIQVPVHFYSLTKCSTKWRYIFIQ